MSGDGFRKWGQLGGALLPWNVERRHGGIETRLQAQLRKAGFRCQSPGHELCNSIAVHPSFRSIVPI